ncbi:Ankyrin repeat domain-containing protein 40 [Dufourea novaeangliae]|uniref:Ankyrin repeat domain-containing protein 40 n=2 Tax=Dufourea novaeangliae TaxID=178035 RepID=A0A154PRV4_DUFNO|nr:Ankyrin repeat domain-containing protein 40 [Dufourea novaeangliae]
MDSFLSYGNRESTRIVLEERLKEAVCFGDIEAVQQLLNIGVDVNAQNFHNGWTPLHWACKKGYLNIAALLLKNGADKNIKSEKGLTPTSTCTNPQILQLLSATDSQLLLNDSTTHNVVPKYLKNDFVQGVVDLGIHTVNNNSLYPDELVLKIRIVDAPDPDFIEVELPRSELTYHALVQICCQELNVDPTHIVKLRKLPNTKIRKDKDIQRLQNFQEIEIVTNAINSYSLLNGIPNTIPIVPGNGYQSISKKDQTILY